MDAQSLSFSLEKAIEPKALAKKVPEVRLSPGGRFMLANVGKLQVIILPNGHIRITFPGEQLESLRRELGANAVALGRLLEAVRAAAGSTVDVGRALSAEGRDLVEYGEIQAIPFKDLRPEFDGFVSAEVLDTVMLGASQVIAEFQTDRFLSQAGELMGRQAVRQAKLADAKALQQKVVATLQDKHLGKARFEKGTGGADYTVVVEECFCSGSPVYGKPLCAIIRGVIRGAFTGFREAENTAVHEVECWGLGHAQCTFEVRTMSV